MYFNFIPSCGLVQSCSHALYQRSIAWLVDGDLLSIGIRRAVPFPRRTHNIQQPVGTVLKSPSVDSLAFDVREFTNISPERRSHPLPPKPSSNNDSSDKESQTNNLGERASDIIKYENLRNSVS
ncbi:hypothetical protein AVEN_150279-1 [Araneus ventricosus]|uniref:Uncharacterized protein n=1 Tax=Araneus ventricosus TaxID=182803 RepID=A0A4Y2J3E8_ARAVE|nr:hypothetical protein AVEN_150279-1 [Araneus ventricosus]